MMLMNRLLISLVTLLISTSTLANEALTFKEPFSPHNGWLAYGLALIVLLVIILVLAKKNRPGSTQKSVCQLIEKKYLGNKTVVYVIAYEQQRFLLADNQHALALHPLATEKQHE